MTLFALDSYSWDFPVPLHKRNNYGLFHITEGGGRFVVEDRAYGVDTGDLILYYPLEAHGYEPAPETGMEATVLTFGLDESDSRFRDELDLIRDKRLFRAPPDATATFRRIGAQLTSGNYYALKAAVCRIESLLYELVSIEHRAVAQSPRDLLDSVILFLYTHYHASLKSVSERFGVSCEYIRRLFRQYLGDSPMHYVMRYKIELLAPLLVRTELSIDEIAERYCFSDAYHLSRAFKKHMGETPTEYRRRHRNRNAVGRKEGRHRREESARGVTRL